jgi:hypothetical protein
MPLHDILMERANLHFQNQGLGPNTLPPNNLLSNVGKVLASHIKEKRDEQRRQQNIKNQMETYEKMMESMAGQGGEISNVSKAGNLTEDGVSQNRSKVINSSTVIPIREVSFGPDGLKIKQGFKTASTTDQKNLIDIRNTEAERAKEEQKREFRDMYIEGDLPESAYLEQMANLGLTPENYQSDTQARDKLRSIRQDVSMAGGQTVPGGQTIPMAGGQTVPPAGEQAVPMAGGSDPQTSEQPSPTTMQAPEGMVFDHYDEFRNPVYRPMSPAEKKTQFDFQNRVKLLREKGLSGEASVRFAGAKQGLKLIQKLKGLLGVSRDSQGNPVSNQSSVQTLLEVAGSKAAGFEEPKVLGIPVTLGLSTGLSLLTPKSPFNF